MQTGHDRLEAITQVLAELSAFFPGWKPTKPELILWARKMMTIPHLDVGLLAETVEFFVDQRSGAFPPSFAEIRKEHGRRVDSRRQAQRKLEQPRQDREGATKARRIVEMLTRTIGDIPEDE